MTQRNSVARKELMRARKAERQELNKAVGDFRAAQKISGHSRLGFVIGVGHGRNRAGMLIAPSRAAYRAALAQLALEDRQ